SGRRIPGIGRAGETGPFFLFFALSAVGPLERGFVHADGLIGRRTLAGRLDLSRHLAGGRDGGDGGVHALLHALAVGRLPLQVARVRLGAAHRLGRAVDTRHQDGLALGGVQVEVGVGRRRLPRRRLVGLGRGRQGGGRGQGEDGQGGQ